jgi:wyosine [tRNA(Phe)-imidazoG37] synthetase (radical SAM superfamily)
MEKLLKAHKDHSRTWKDFLYVYAVISRRSKGVSIGVNLNPDKICNFNCAYCEVDRVAPARVKKVDIDVLKDELRQMLEIWESGALFQEEKFYSAPREWRRLNDIAFSGDGEPTTCPVFIEAVQAVFDLRNELAPRETKLVLITDSSCLNRPNVQKGLKIMQQGAHEIWAKLDAGTEAYYKKINRSKISFDRILKNITETAKWMPLMIQSLFLKVHGKPPTDEEIFEYCNRVNEILKAGGQILKLQIYTIARPTPEKWATALSKPELDHIAAIVRSRVPLPQEISYGV